MIRSKWEIDVKNINSDKGLNNVMHEDKGDRNAKDLKNKIDDLGGKAQLTCLRSQGAAKRRTEFTGTRQYWKEKGKQAREGRGGFGAPDKGENGRPANSPELWRVEEDSLFVGDSGLTRISAGSDKEIVRGSAVKITEHAVRAPW